LQPNQALRRIGVEQETGEFYNQVTVNEKAPQQRKALFPFAARAEERLAGCGQRKSAGERCRRRNATRDVTRYATAPRPAGKAPMHYAYAVRFAPDWPSAACAAARRAIGTRKGEHET